MVFLIKDFVKLIHVNGSCKVFNHVNVLQSSILLKAFFSKLFGHILELDVESDTVLCFQY